MKRRPRKLHQPWSIYLVEDDAGIIADVFGKTFRGKNITEAVGLATNYIEEEEQKREQRSR